MTDSTRAALSQPEPAGLSDESGMIPMEYADVDSGARIVCEPSEDRPSTGCWVVYNSRHISPSKEFSTAEAAYHALRAAIAADRAQRQPVPPEPGEVQELVGLIRQIALAWEPNATLLGNMTAGQLARAADLLESLSPPQPVPVSERLPGPEDLGPDGAIWFRKTDRAGETHWLPAHALPLPGEVGHD